MRQRHRNVPQRMVRTIRQVQPAKTSALFRIRVEPSAIRSPITQVEPLVPKRKKSARFG